MSIGLVMKVTYKETCHVCDKIAQFVSKVFNKLIEVGETLGYSVAASRLAQMGYHEQAKECLMQIEKKKK